METIYQSLIEGRWADAQSELKTFVRGRFGLEVATVEFQNSAVSLNSFKGVMITAQGGRYFFKTHIEKAGEVDEYAGVQLLESAGYPVLVPLFVSSERGKELLIYPLIEDPSVFDLVVALRESRSCVEVEALKKAQETLDQKLLELYKKNFDPNPPPHFPAIQQLFYRRLSGERFEQFYRGRSRRLGNRHVAFEELECANWIVNGKSYGQMCDWLATARRLLALEKALPFTIIGHGDAHNGNLFYNSEGGLRYFDPAFAGRHDPFLDLAKPLFHNTFARWMYFPAEVEKTVHLDVHWKAGQLFIDHDFQPNDVERLFLNSKMKHVIHPLVAWLSEQGVLPSDWCERLRASLLCCPLLTVNLFDEQKYSPAMSALGFAMVAQMAYFDFNSYS